MATDKKVALITGANKGIGLEIARQLGKQGIIVVVGSRDPQKGQEAVDTLKAEGIDAYTLELEVTDAADREAALPFLQEKFGRLDILVNNAGIMLESEGITPNTLSRTFDANAIALLSGRNPAASPQSRPGGAHCASVQYFRFADRTRLRASSAGVRLACVQRLQSRSEYAGSGAS